MFSWLAVTYLFSRLKIDLSILQLVIQTNGNHKILFLNFFFSKRQCFKKFWFQASQTQDIFGQEISNIVTPNVLESTFIWILFLQVHTFYRSCNKKASCNCAVAVRSGDDVIVLDVCGKTRRSGKKRRPLTKKLFLNGELTPGTSVYQHNKGKKYEVNCRKSK